MKEKFIKIAESEVGYREGKNNDTKYGTWFGLNYNPWCMMFIDWSANQADKSLLDNIIPKTASAPRAYNWFKKKGLISSTPRVGDIGFYLKKNKKGVMNPEHAFIIMGVNGKKITTIEGNLNNKVIKNTRTITSSLKFGNVEWNKVDTAPIETWTSGNYRLLFDKALRRTHAITLTNFIKVKNCTSDVKKYLTSKNTNANAYLKKGTEIKINEIYKESNNRVWGKFGNVWLVLCNKDGTRQADKI